MPLWGRGSVLVVVALALAGCGGDDNESSSESTGNTATEQQTPAPAADTEASPLVIEVQRGVGGASLGMSEDEVRDALGEPVRSDQLRNATGPYTELTYPDGLTVALQRGGEFAGG